MQSNRKYILIVLLVFLSSCLKNEIPLNYYEDTNRIRGNEKPSAVVLSDFDMNTQQLDWSDSIDPDTEKPVSEYYLYCYSKYIPENLYDERYILFSITGESLADLSNYDIDEGHYYLMVIGSDGFRISDRSNFIELNIDSGYVQKSDYFGTITDYDDHTSRCYIDY